MAMTNQEKFNKAQGRIRCTLEEKQRELCNLTLNKINLIESIDRLEYRLKNLVIVGEADQREKILSQKRESEDCLDVLLDEIHIVGVIINAMTIGVEKIKEGLVSFEVDDDAIDRIFGDTDDIEEYTNKVSVKKKLFGR